MKPLKLGIFASSYIAPVVVVVVEEGIVARGVFGGGYEQSN